MQYKDAINPEAVHPEDPFLVVNTRSNTIIESWATEDGAQRACKILNRHYESIANEQPYKVIKKEIK